MEHKIIVVGIGPGSEDYLLPIAKKTIDFAKVLVGSKRSLSSFQNKMALTHAITGEIEAALAFIEENLKSQDVVVMVSGDPGYYSFLTALNKRFSCIEVIPGISSMQLAFARLALPWHDADLISLHGREVDLARLKYSKGRKLGFLTDSKYTSATIASLLLKNDWPQNVQLYACNHLSYENESIVTMTLQEAASTVEYKNCIVVVIA